MPPLLLGINEQGIHIVSSNTTSLFHCMCVADQWLELWASRKPAAVAVSEHFTWQRCCTRISHLLPVPSKTDSFTRSQAAIAWIFTMLLDKISASAICGSKAPSPRCTAEERRFVAVEPATIVSANALRLDSRQNGESRHLVSNMGCIFYLQYVPE
jgi:hypothetical protein